MPGGLRSRGGGRGAAGTELQLRERQNQSERLFEVELIKAGAAAGSVRTRWKGVDGGENTQSYSFPGWVSCWAA